MVKLGREDGDRVRRQNIGMIHREPVRPDFLMWRTICLFSMPFDKQDLCRNNVQLINGLKVGFHPPPQTRCGGAPLGGRWGDTTCGSDGQPLPCYNVLPELSDTCVLLQGLPAFWGSCVWSFF